MKYITSSTGMSDLKHNGTQKKTSFFGLSFSCSFSRCGSFLFRVCSKDNFSAWFKTVSFLVFHVVWGFQVVPLERSDIIQAPCDTKSCSCMEWRQTIIWTYPIPVSISPECIVNAPFMKSISYLFHVKWPLSLKTLTWHEKM